MKRLILIMILILILVPVFVIPVAGMTDAEIVTAITNAKTVVIGIKNVGFKIWVRANWWVFILAVVGIGRLIIFITPSKKDDRWFAKYILNPIHWIGQVLSLSKK